MPWKMQVRIVILPVAKVIRSVIHTLQVYFQWFLLNCPLLVRFVRWPVRLSGLFK